MTAIIISGIIEIAAAAAIVAGFLFEHKLITLEDKLVDTVKHKFAKREKYSELEQMYADEKRRKNRLSHEYELLLHDYDKPHLTVINCKRGADSSSMTDVA